MSAAPDRMPVVIIGAGPTGVAAATLLGRYGVRCLVLDRWKGVYTQPRAVHVDDEVCRIIDRLGLLQEFKAISRPGQGLRLLDPEHRVLSTFDRAGQQRKHGHPQANMFDQPELEQLFRSNLEAFPTVELRGNAEVTDVTQDDLGRVSVDYTDRVSGESRSVVASYVLGCDGANSIVRSAVGAAMVDLGFEQRWLVVDVESSQELHQWEGVHQLCDPRRAGTYMRVGGTRYRWEFRLLPGESASGYQDVDALLPLISPWTRRIPAIELHVVRVAEYTFRAQVADRWRDGHIFLLGDAAHLTPPFIGQGMGAGLRDAMNLAWKLAGVLEGDLPESALDTYEIERKPHARSLIKLAKLVGAAMTQGGRTGDRLRRVIMPRMKYIPNIGTLALDSETPPLSRSSLVRRGFALHSLAGRLAPNAQLPTGSRLDDVLGGGFALVTSLPLSSRQRASLTGRGATVVDATSGTELHGWLRRARVRAALVRPDGTVMVAGRSLSGVYETVPRFTGWNPAAALPPDSAGPDHRRRAPQGMTGETPDHQVRVPTEPLSR